MMIRIGDSDYLDLDEEPEVERRVKLFQDVSTIEGDFSYSFDFPKTKHNVSIIKIWNISTNEKRWSKRINATVEDNSGIAIYSGFIRIQNSDNKRFYSASFFSGNSNWIDELNFDMSDLDWSSFDKNDTDFDFDATEGVVSPLVDNGFLRDRKSYTFATEEFVPFIYVKTVFNVLLSSVGMKLSGDILNSPIFNKMITSTGNGAEAKDEVDKRNTYAGKITSQSITASASVYTVMTFPSISFPYFNSTNNNWDTTNSRYTFDIEARRWSLRLKFRLTDYGSFILRIVKNGTTVSWYETYNDTIAIDYEFTERELGAVTNVGDYFDVQIRFPNIGRTIIAGSSIEIKPKRFFRIFAKTIIPEMTAATFVSNISRCLNLLISYNEKNKTITANFFDNVLQSDPIDLSNSITILSSDYEVFVSDYSKRNLLSWGSQTNEYVDIYNRDNEIGFGVGIIEIDNDFLSNEDTLIEMDFDAPFQSLYNNLGIELPFTDFLESTVITTRDITSVTDSSGYAFFNFNGDSFSADIFRGVFRISECSNETYNGTYYGQTASNSITGYGAFDTSATGKIEFLQIDLKSSSNPVILLNNTGLSFQEVTGSPSFQAGNLTPRTEIAIANFTRTDNFIGSLSFADLKNELFIITESVLNKGELCYGIGYFTLKVYRSIDFLRRVRVNESVYYVNNITGYKGPQYPCEVELIKLN